MTYCDRFVIRIVFEECSVAVLAFTIFEIFFVSLRVSLSEIIPLTCMLKWVLPPPPPPIAAAKCAASLCITSGLSRGSTASLAAPPLGESPIIASVGAVIKPPPASFVTVEAGPSAAPLPEVT
jgi:hypothetical protein